MTHVITYFSAFSGIGGFELALKKAHTQTQCIGFSEVNKHALTVYDRHFPTHTNFGDIAGIEADTLPDFDLLVGGFPCQSFSIAGRRCGLQDERGALVLELLRIIGQKRPRLLLLENVKGLLSHDKGVSFRKILTALDELGYHCEWQVLNSAHFGVPQFRQRVFIVGHLGAEHRARVFPLMHPAARLSKKPVSMPVTSGIRAVWRLRDPVCDRLAALGGRKVRRLTPIECERLQGFPDQWTLGLSDGRRLTCLGNAVTVPVVTAIVQRLLR